MPGPGEVTKDKLPIQEDIDIFAPLIENTRKTEGLIAAACIARADYYDKKLANDPEIMKKRVDRIEICSNAINVVNAASDKNKAVDFSKNAELQKLRESGKELKNVADKMKAEATKLIDEAKALETEATQLESEGKAKEANLKKAEAAEKKEHASQMNSEAAELMDIVNALHTFSDKQYYTEAEKNAYIQGLQNTINLLDKYNQSQVTISNRMYTERNNFHTEAMNSIRKLGDIIMGIIRNISGR